MTGYRTGPTRREAYILGALLVLACAAPLALRSSPWVELFARGPILVDLGSPFVGPVRREAGGLVVGGSGREIVVLRTPLEGKPGGRYLLRLWREESPPLTVSLIGPGWTRIDGPYRRAAGSGLERIMLSSREAPAGIQLSIAFQSPGVLRVTGIEVQELSPASLWFPPLLRGLGPLLALVFCLCHWRWLAGRAGSSAPVSAWNRGLLALALFLACLFVFYEAPVAQVVDSRYLSAVSQSLLTFGTTAIPDGFLDVNPATAYQLARVKGQTVYFFSHAPAVLNAPFVWIYGLLGVRPVDAAGSMRFDDEVEIFRLCAAAVAAGLCLLLYGIARRWLDAGPSLALTAVFAFGTQIFSTISRPYWSHAWASLLLAGAVYLLVIPWARERPGAYVAIGSLLSWAFFCRPNLALSVVAITVLVAARRRSFLPQLVATGFVWLILLILHSQQVFGTLIPPYFLSSHLYSGRLTVPTESHSYLSAMAGTLVSPSRGLFVFVPLYALTLWGVARYWRRLPDRALAIAALAVIVAHWQLVSSFRNWWGGSAYGPRLFSDIVVWFFVLAVLGLAAAGRTPESRSSDWRPLLRFAGAIGVAFSLFVNYRGATAPETIEWPVAAMAGSSHAERQLQFQEKIWDWRDPQFLAGLLDRPP